jgi:23S rRNA (pseudouridine1915-N3)-methyltransferase
MRTIHIITLGKLKENYWQEAEAEYLKRLTSFAKITIHELKEESFTEKDPVEFVKEKEAKKLEGELDKIKDAFIIALDEKGKIFSSVEFSKKLENLQQSNSTFIFIIGGPLGLHSSILEKAHLKDDIHF